MYKMIILHDLGIKLTSTLRASPDLIGLPEEFTYSFFIFCTFLKFILKVIFKVVVGPSEWKENLNVQKKCTCKSCLIGLVCTTAD